MWIVRIGTAICAHSRRGNALIASSQGASVDFCSWHIADLAIHAEHVCSGPQKRTSQAFGYADSALYTDAFDSSVCRMISGTVLPAFLRFRTFWTVSATKLSLIHIS